MKSATDRRTNGRTNGRTDTERQTDRQTNKVTTITLLCMHAEGVGLESPVNQNVKTIKPIHSCIMTQCDTTVSQWLFSLIAWSKINLYVRQEWNLCQGLGMVICTTIHLNWLLFVLVHTFISLPPMGACSGEL